MSPKIASPSIYVFPLGTGVTTRRMYFRLELGARERHRVTGSPGGHQTIGTYVFTVMRGAAK